MGFDELWPGGPGFFRREGVFALGTDAVLLAHFAGAIREKKLLDLGSGSGVLAILLAARCPRLTADGLELRKAAVEAARENAAANGLLDRVRFMQEDLRKYRPGELAGAYGAVIANPPYFPLGNGKSAPEEAAASAREERNCTLADVCGAAAFFAKWGGKFLLIHRPERLADVFGCLRESGFEPKRLRLVQNSARTAPSLALVESRRGGKPGLAVEPPLLLTEESGGESEEIKAVYHRRPSGE